MYYNIMLHILFVAMYFFYVTVCKSQWNSCVVRCKGDKIKRHMFQTEISRAQSLPLCCGLKLMDVSLQEIVFEAAK